MSAPADPLVDELRCDYADAFELRLPQPDPRSAEHFARDGLEGAPRWLRAVIVVAHRRVLRFRLAPGADRGHVLGWRVVTARPEVVRLETEGPLMSGVLLVRRVDATAVVLTTLLAFHRPRLAQALWLMVGPVHRNVAPYLMRRSAAMTSSTRRPEPPRWHGLVWRGINPLTRPLAGLAPWWVLVETVGARSGARRLTPLAAGPEDADGMWLISVHGRAAAWVRNLEAEPCVRVRHQRRWRAGSAAIHEYDAAVAATFNAYARQGPRVFGVEPVLVRVHWRS